MRHIKLLNFLVLVQVTFYRKLEMLGSSPLLLAITDFIKLLYFPIELLCSPIKLVSFPIKSRLKVLVLVQVTFYRNLEMLGTSPLPLAITDCFNNDEGVLMGSAGATLQPL